METETSAAPPIPLVAALARTLDDSDISYCHWKSNEAIRRSERGENDLDLLVGRSDAERFRAVLHDLGFTRAERTAPPYSPGKEDFFGFDTAAGRLVHVDVHYQLVLGHDRSKNYRVPIEEPFLASARHDGILRVPSVEFEFVILVIRMVLKYAVWDELAWSALRGRSAGPKASERRELAHLDARIERRRVASIVGQHLPSVSVRLFDECIAVAHGERSISARLRTGRRLEAALDAFAQRGALLDSGVRLWRRGRLGVATRGGRAARDRLATGGAIIGVLGGDGSGKSTALDEIARWLGDEFDLRTIHLGKPPWSPLTYLVRGTLKLAVALRARILSRGALSRREFLEPSSGPRAFLWLACTARDRYRLYRRARRFVNGGGLVVSDRYPHGALSTMEVAQISRLADGRAGPMVRALAQLEERYHDKIAPPDLLVVLLVDPDTAVQRKLDEPPDYVRRRALEIWSADWGDSAVRVIDASQPPETVAAELKALIWRTLT